MHIAPLRPLWPARRWWLALLLILLLGGGLRYTGYNFSLPYIDYIDEPNHNLAARMIVDWGTARPLDHDSYAPGIVAVNYFFVRFFQDPATPPSTVLWMVRLVSVTVSVGLLVVLALFGYHLAGPPAGLLATALWAITPTFVSVSRFGVPDIYVSFFAILSLWLTLAGIRYLRPRWTTYAVYALMLAVLFKYQAIFLTPVILLAPLVQRDVMRRVVTGNILRFVLFLAWLLLFTPILVPPGPDQGAPPNWRQHTTSVVVPSLEVLLYNLEQLLWLQMPARIGRGALDLWLLLPGWAGLAMLALRRNREILYCLVLPVLGCTDVDVRAESVWQDRCPSGGCAPATLLTLLAGIGWTLWLEDDPRALRDWSSGRVASRWALLAPLALLLALLILALPSLQASLANAHEHTLPDRRNELATWADTTLAPGKFFATARPLGHDSSHRGLLVREPQDAHHADVRKPFGAVFFCTAGSIPDVRMAILFKYQAIFHAGILLAPLVQRDAIRRGDRSCALYSSSPLWRPDGAPIKCDLPSSPGMITLRGCSGCWKTTRRAILPAPHC